AIGSVMLMLNAPGSPACLGQARNVASHGGFTDLGAAQFEFLIYTPGTARQLTAIALPDGARVTRHFLQLLLRFPLLLFGSRGADDGGLELRALGGEAGHQLGALLLAHDHRNLCHCSILSP